MPKLEAVGLCKVYPGTVALDDVSLGFDGGKVHALIGKNGAGKSTLVKILAGAARPSGGQIRIDGRAVRLRSPRDAFRQGIATVYQELSLVPELTVGENILFGRLPTLPGLRQWIIDWGQVFRRSRAVLEELGVEVEVRAKVASLGAARAQLVEIAKAMSFQPGVLMLDEPTSALAHHEIARLFQVLRDLARRGVAVLYISHRLHELPQVADTVSVLRDGRSAGTIAVAEATPQRITAMMFGEAVRTRRPSQRVVAAGTVLEARNLTRAGKLADVSFSLDAGEVLGIAGMLGSGRSELLMALFGAEPLSAGEVRVGGRRVRRLSPAAMKRLGLGLAPEDRKRQALVLTLSVCDNMCLAALGRIARWGLIRRGRQRRLVAGLIHRLQIAPPRMDAPVVSLSGGNQQKVVLGNWLATEPRILLLDEPTRGIDVLAKQQVFDTIRQLSREGVSAIFVSSELEELLEVCHRVLVLRGGRIVAELSGADLTLERMMETCLEP
ncbi:MAG: sugar ABC transporter ATP-binding protein [Thermoguttaceae bacterium]